MKRREQILMETELEPKLAMSKAKSLSIRWRTFCEQWRHAYLLLFALFYMIWRISAPAVRRLDDIRIMNGLHPGDVLLLMQILRLIYVPVVGCALLYVFSFRIRALNTPEALSGTALSACVILAFVLLSALLHVSVG